MNLGARIGVVIDVGRVEPDEFDGIDAHGVSGVQPFGAREKCRGIPGSDEPSAQRNRRKGVSGIRTCYHRDPHGPTLPQRRLR
jgi:hypothetical protein